MEGKTNVTITEKKDEEDSGFSLDAWNLENKLRSNYDKNPAGISDKLLIAWDRADTFGRISFQSKRILAHGDRGGVISPSEFQKRLQVFSGGMLNYVDWRNVVLAGGAVSNIMNTSCDGSYITDMDLFVYGMSPKDARHKILTLIDSIRACHRTMFPEHGDILVLRNKRVITLLPLCPTHKRFKVQIILRNYRNIAEVLVGFDVDSCCLAYDGRDVFFTQRSLNAFKYRLNVVDIERRSPSYEQRLFKYYQRGFGVYIPFKYEDKANKIFHLNRHPHGLDRLFSLIKYPKSQNFKKFLHFMTLRPTIPPSQAVISDYEGTNGEQEFKVPRLVWRVKDSVRKFNANLPEDLRYMMLERGSAVRNLEKDTGKLELITHNPGQQFTGSFNPLKKTDWICPDYKPYGLDFLGRPQLLLRIRANDPTIKLAELYEINLYDYSLFNPLSYLIMYYDNVEFVIQAWSNRERICNDVNLYKIDYLTLAVLFSRNTLVHFMLQHLTGAKAPVQIGEIGGFQRQARQNFNNQIGELDISEEENEENECDEEEQQMMEDEDQLYEPQQAQQMMVNDPFLPQKSKRQEFFKQLVREKEKFFQYDLLYRICILLDNCDLLKIISGFQEFPAKDYLEELKKYQADRISKYFCINYNQKKFREFDAKEFIRMGRRKRIARLYSIASGMGQKHKHPIMNFPGNLFKTLDYHCLSIIEIRMILQIRNNYRELAEVVLADVIRPVELDPSIEHSYEKKSFEQYWLDTTFALEKKKQGKKDKLKDQYSRQVIREIFGLDHPMINTNRIDLSAKELQTVEQKMTKVLTKYVKDPIKSTPAQMLQLMELTWGKHYETIQDYPIERLLDTDLFSCVRELLFELDSVEALVPFLRTKKSFRAGSGEDMKYTLNHNLELFFKKYSDRLGPNLRDRFDTLASERLLSFQNEIYVKYKKEFRNNKAHIDVLSTGTLPKSYLKDSDVKEDEDTSNNENVFGITPMDYLYNGILFYYQKIVLNQNPVKENKNKNKEDTEREEAKDLEKLQNMRVAFLNVERNQKIGKVSRGACADMALPKIFHMAK